jgi:proteasome lid subunit RPN8/RPN11
MGMDAAVTRLEVTGAAIAVMVADAARAAPLECCGLLLGQELGQITQARPATNVHGDPARHFEIDPAALIAAYRNARAGGPALLGFYHSHPNGHPRPSASDCEHAGGDGRVWAIIADGQPRFWRDTPEGFMEVSSTVVGD